mmetsp:Transcript_34182/g.109774  ORF Transcript_34182/g.109774 Transcript_34182/m.109774 type:complete len:328 (+) Transcript_34182:256-1239(+)
MYPRDRTTRSERASPQRTVLWPASACQASNLCVHLHTCTTATWMSSSGDTRPLGDSTGGMSNASYISLRLLTSISPSAAASPRDAGAGVISLTTGGGGAGGSAGWRKGFAGTELLDALPEGSAPALTVDSSVTGWSMITGRLLLRLIRARSSAFGFRFTAATLGSMVARTAIRDGLEMRLLRAAFLEAGLRGRPAQSNAAGPPSSGAASLAAPSSPARPRQKRSAMTPTTTRKPAAATTSRMRTGGTASPSRAEARSCCVGGEGLLSDAWTTSAETRSGDTLSGPAKAGTMAVTSSGVIGQPATFSLRRTSCWLGALPSTSSLASAR